MKSALACTIASVSGLLVISPLGLVFFYLLIHGAGSVNWDFFTKLPAPVGAVGGGMANAILGSLQLLALAGAIGIPVGVLGGVYLAEYGSARINSVLRFLADVLNGIPSITWGVVVYGLIVLRFKSFSALAGGLALGLIMIPLILRTTEEVILLVPNGYREASLALGVSRWRTVLTVILPSATGGLVTGAILAVARGAADEIGFGHAISGWKGAWKFKPAPARFCMKQGRPANRLMLAAKRRTAQVD